MTVVLSNINIKLVMIIYVWYNRNTDNQYLLLKILNDGVRNYINIVNFEVVDLVETSILSET